MSTSPFGTPAPVAPEPAAPVEAPQSAGRSRLLLFGTAGLAALVVAGGAAVLLTQGEPAVEDPAGVGAPALVPVPPATSASSPLTTAAPPRVVLSARNPFVAEVTGGGGAGGGGEDPVTALPTAEPTAVVANAGTAFGAADGPASTATSGSARRGTSPSTVTVTRTTTATATPSATASPTEEPAVPLSAQETCAVAAATLASVEVLLDPAGDTGDTAAALGLHSPVLTFRTLVGVTGATELVVALDQVGDDLAAVRDDVLLQGATRAGVDRSALDASAAALLGRCGSPGA